MTAVSMASGRQGRASASQPLALLHLINARSANVGNGALTSGVEALLHEDLGRPIAFTHEAWDDYSFGLKPFDRDFVRLVNRSDGMIVGGAVAMNARPHYANAGMRFDLPYELWREIERPLVFYGLSHRHWPGQVYHHAEKLKRALHEIVEQPRMLLGLRNDGTRKWLAETLGIESDRFHVVPDPGVFAVAELERSYHELAEGRRNVLLAFNDEDWEGRYRTDDVRKMVIAGLVQAVERMLAKWDVNVVIVPHYFDDFRMAIDFVDRCQPRLAHQHMIATGLAGIRGSAEFYGRYLCADLVISMRVHSMSPAIGLGVPMIPLVTQQRMSDFLADIDLGDLAVDAFDREMPDRLSAAIDKTLGDPETVRMRFRAARSGMRERARAFNAMVGKLFDAS